jgi:hypothetical protein
MTGWVYKEKIKSWVGSANEADKDYGEKVKCPGCGEYINHLWHFICGTDGNITFKTIPNITITRDMLKDVGIRTNKHDCGTLLTVVDDSLKFTAFKAYLHYLDKQ